MNIIESNIIARVKLSGKSPMDMKMHPFKLRLRLSQTL